ncbi:rhomboid family intramembrane serine protease [Nonomuraea sp. NBC_00507]|uniref:rhomboid family intramembrane serine protease n=1 Tax=Nonomuraea sp. NBC_00507 TaxID=2976002 RepID=UPI002E170E62
MIAEARKAFWVMVGFLAVIWVVQIVSWASGYALSYEFGVQAWNPASLPDIVASGLGAWFTSQPMSVGAGASGVVFGYFGYVLVRGAFDRHLIDIVVGVVMALCFAYQFAGLLPQEGIGWQAHLFGFLGGLLGGWLFRDRGRPRPATASPDPNSRATLLKELDDLGL